MISFDEIFDSELAEPAVIVPASGIGQATINVIYDNEYAAQVMDGIIYENNGPQVTCKGSDIRHIKTGDYIKVRDINYKVAERKPSSDGTTILILKQ